MIPKDIHSALVSPTFKAGDFVASQAGTQEEKAKFANTLLRFLANDCPFGSFTNALYRRLMNCFGHIAHYDKQGFYGTFFSSVATKIEFLNETLTYPLYGSPEHTFVDAEKALIQRIKSAGLLFFYETIRIQETQAAELQLLEALRQKYPEQAQA